MEINWLAIVAWVMALTSGWLVLGMYRKNR